MIYPLASSTWGKEEPEAIQRVIDSDMYTMGKQVKQFEEEFAKMFGTENAVMVNSGSSANLLMLSLLKWKYKLTGERTGERKANIIVPVVGWSTTYFPIVQNGFQINFVDVDPNTFNVSPDEIKRRITPKTKAIITVGIYGLSPDMDPIMEIAEEHNLYVIEDNAQCLLNKYKGRQAGTIGHIASYSFENTKHLSCGEGGMIVTDDEKLAEMCRKVGGHGFKNLRAEEGRIRLNSDIFQNC